MRSTKAIIFDLDGTLIDTVPDIALSMNNTLVKLGYSKLLITDFAGYVGKGTWYMAEKLSEKMNIDNIELFHEKYLSEYRKNLTVLSKPFNGIESVLNFCNQYHIKIAVVTNKDHDMTLELLKRLLPQQFFCQIFGYQGMHTKKPDPFTALEAARLMHVLPEDCLFVGDTPIDIQTAKNAGMQSAAVLWGYSNRDVLAKHMPNHMFAEVVDLQNFVVKIVKQSALQTS